MVAFGSVRYKPDRDPNPRIPARIDTMKNMVSREIRKAS
jgi:hypothetical protein